VLKQLKHLKIVFPIFNDCKSHAGLALKPPKCVLVPLCAFSEEVHANVCRWVAHNVPEWKPLAKLLGFYIGPQAGTMMWQGPLTKYKDRINDIKRGCASIALNCHTYNTRIVPVFSYVSQLVPLPGTFHELFGMCSAIRAPNALRESDYYQLHKYGGPKFRSISASCASALFRTSLVTVTSWPRWIQQLEECAKQCLTYVQHSKGVISPPHWDTDPIALNLKNAFCGFPNSPKWAEGGAILINKLLTLNGNKPINPGDKFVQCNSGLQTLAYNVLMDSHHNLGFKKHMIERISILFHPFELDWNSIQFSMSISALQPFNSGKVMKVIKTWMNAWTTSSRMGGAHHIYPCLSGCKDVTVRLGHYIECAKVFTLWKFMHRDLSIHATDRWGLNSPNKRDIIQICCVFFRPIMLHLHMSNGSMKYM